MTKPKFTPDPAPNIDGLPPEQQVRMILDHMQRQFNRAEDWWPKDYGARLNQLELLTPYKTGDWPIVDYSYVSFAYEIVQSYQECAPTTATIANRLNYNTAATSFSTQQNGMHVKSDGTTLWTSSVGTGKGSGIYEWTMSTPFDVSSASYTQFKAITPGGGPLSGTAVRGLSLSDTGDKLFYLDVDTSPGDGDARIVEMALSTNWDISSATETTYYKIESTVSVSNVFQMSADGMHFYVGTNNASDTTVHQFDLSSAWDISTSSFSKSQALGAPANGPLLGFALDPAGKNLLVDSVTTSRVERFALSTAYDISTASSASTITINDSQDMYGGLFVPDCTTLLINDAVGTEIDQYTIS